MYTYMYLLIVLFLETSHEIFQWIFLSVGIFFVSTQFSYKNIFCFVFINNTKLNQIKNILTKYNI